jgi:hypothetical protein
LWFLAAREARAKIIAAEGEQKASRALKVRIYYSSCQKIQKKIKIFRKLQM